MAQRTQQGGRLFTVFVIAAVAVHLWTVANALAYWGMLGAIAAFILPIVAELAVVWKLWSATCHLWNAYAITAATVLVGWYPAASLAAVLGMRRDMRPASGRQ